MSRSWRWIEKQALLLLHAESLSEHGGLEGLRDEGLLDSALARPRHLHTYEDEVDCAQLAASYGFGVIKNHPFTDGNKRAGLLAVGLFLGLNGYRLLADQLTAIATVMALADGSLPEAGFAQWLRENAKPHQE